MSPWQQFAYDVGQAMRVAWFLGHSRVAERAAPPLTEPLEITGRLPSRAEMLADLFALFRQDRANIAAGRYRLPHDLVADPLAAWRQSRRFRADIKEVVRRRREKKVKEWREDPNGNGRRYPDYYLQNFHYQTDGYLSDHSAELYD
ncbi:MAG: class I SAM-dependent methyltransferase, partial [Geminicoccaceae bacterium]